MAVAYSARRTKLEIEGVLFPHIITLVIDHASRRVRGSAFSGDEVPVMLRELRRGDKIALRLESGEREEFSGRAEVVMFRVRFNPRNLIRISFIFALLEPEAK